MNLIQRALDRPISVFMAFAALVLLGLISLAFLPLDLLPEVSYPVLSVTTRLGGYSPPEIEQTLTKPMEAALASLNNLVRLKSFSREGVSEFRLSFEVGTGMDFVMQEVRERLNQLTPEFPPDTRTPQLMKYDPASAPVMVVSLFGDLDPVSLRLAGEEIIQKNLNRVSGVAHTEVLGGRRPEITMEPRIERLRALGLTVLTLTELLKKNNLELALGSLDRGTQRIPLRSLGGFRELQDHRLRKHLPFRL